MEKNLFMHPSSADRCTVSQSQTAAADVRGTERISNWFGSWREPIQRWIGNNSSVPSAEVDDLTQEVFVKLLRYSNDVTVQHPQAYLFTIAMNVVGAWRERSRVRMPHDDAWLADLQIDTDLEPEPMVERAQKSAALRAAVDRLPMRQREILLLYVSEGLTYKQIAKRKKLTYRIVLRDLTRAYVTLRKQLAVDGS
jgi:RNA polymerase sigma factor (sigma-70 family)